MSNWRLEIDCWLKREEERKKEESARERREEERKALAKLRRHFKCHICGEVASGPKEKRGQGSDDWQPQTYTDWDFPGNLSQCSLCGRWVCKRHIHRGICQKCAGQLR